VQARVDQDLFPPYSLLERAALAIMRLEYPEEFHEDGELGELGQLYWHRRGAWYVDAAQAVLTTVREDLT